MRRILAWVLVLMLVAAVGVCGVSVWWAKAVVATGQQELAVERQNVSNLKASSENLWTALREKTREAEELRQKCERLRAELASERSKRPQDR